MVFRRFLFTEKAVLTRKRNSVVLFKESYLLVRLSYGGAKVFYKKKKKKKKKKNNTKNNLRFCHFPVKYFAGVFDAH